MLDNIAEVESLARPPALPIGARRDAERRGQPLGSAAKAGPEFLLVREHTAHTRPPGVEPPLVHILDDERDEQIAHSAGVSERRAFDRLTRVGVRRDLA